MTALHISSEDESRFAEYLKHRQLNEKATALLASAKEGHNLKASDLHSAKGLAYAEIAKNLIKAVNQDWIGQNTLVSLLSDSELAGKQHVCVFHLPEKGKSRVLDSLRSPANSSSDDPLIEDFLRIPEASTAQLIVDEPKRVVVKIVTKRSYWMVNVLENSDPDREVYERCRMQERSVVVVKCNVDDDTIQFRVPPSMKGPVETAKAIYQFLHETLESQYPGADKSWFRNTRQFPIQDAFPKIIKNKDDFELWHDTPEDRNIRTQISRKGRPKSGMDLRDDRNWHHDKGYSRSTIRGFWKNGREPLYLHMNSDRVRISKDTHRDLARLFIPSICNDKDLDDVIAWIRRHI
jgi:hypothetical protein